MLIQVVAALLSGLLLGIAYQFVGALSFVAYVPLLLMLGLKPASTRKGTVGLLYLTFFTYHAIGNWWVCSWQERTDPYLFVSGIALALFHPFFLSLPFYVLSAIRKSTSARVMLCAAPFAIAGFEWLHGQTDASYPWLTTGYMLTNTPWGQLAEFVGVYGLSFLVAVINALIAWWLAYSLRTERRFVLPTATLLVLAVSGVLGYVRGLGFREDGTDRRFTVTIVQPSMDPWDKWTDGWSNVVLHERIVDSLRAANATVDVGLVIWPETAIPYTIRRPLYSMDWERLRTWVDTSCSGLLTGYADYFEYPSSSAPPSARTSRQNPNIRYDVFNAAMIVPPRKQSTGHSDTIPVHRKSMLTPFAERMPFADQLSFATKWIEWGVGISAWGKGQQRAPLVFQDSISIGTIICIESIYPEIARSMVNHGANVLCVITNDAWYNGTWGPDQHLTIARMRAIEERRWLVRCGMSGVSGIIHPDGTTDPTISRQCSPMQRGCINASVGLLDYPTMYARIGDPWSPTWLILTLGLFILTRFPSLLRNMHVRFFSRSKHTP